MKCSVMLCHVFAGTYLVLYLHPVIVPVCLAIRRTSATMADKHSGWYCTHARAQSAKGAVLSQALTCSLEA